jgi:hypothetical protein
MTSITTRRPRLAIVAGVLAAAVATSSGAYAAGAMITSSNQIKNGVVNTGDVKNGSLRVKDLNKKTVDALAPVLEGWHDLGTTGNPSLNNPWAKFPPAQNPAFRKDADGIVTLRGAVSYGSNNGSGSTIFTLPVGYRPSGCAVFDVATFNGLGAQDPLGAVQICEDGEVDIYSGGDDRYVSLESISFSAS